MLPQVIAPVTLETSVPAPATVSVVLLQVQFALELLPTALIHPPVVLPRPMLPLTATYAPKILSVSLVLVTCATPLLDVCVEPLPPLVVVPPCTVTTPPPLLLLSPVFQQVLLLALNVLLIATVTPLLLVTSARPESASVVLALRVLTTVLMPLTL